MPVVWPDAQASSRRAPRLLAVARRLARGLALPLALAHTLALGACERSGGANASGASAAETTDARSARATAASSAAALSVCERAAERYVGCMEKLLGEEAGALARSKQKEGIPACAQDPMTVAMYDKCLPEPDCARFQGCMTEFAEHAEPPPPAP